MNCFWYKSYLLLYFFTSLLLYFFTSLLLYFFTSFTFPLITFPHRFLRLVPFYLRHPPTTSIKLSIILEAFIPCYHWYSFGTICRQIFELVGEKGIFECNIWQSKSIQIFTIKFKNYVSNRFFNR